MVFSVLSWGYPQLSSNIRPWLHFKKPPYHTPLSTAGICCDSHLQVHSFYACVIDFQSLQFHELMNFVCFCCLRIWAFESFQIFSISGWWFFATPLKTMSSSVGMFQTTNQFQLSFTQTKRFRQATFQHLWKPQSMKSRAPSRDDQLAHPTCVCRVYPQIPRKTSSFFTGFHHLPHENMGNLMENLGYYTDIQPISGPICLWQKCQVGARVHGFMLLLRVLLWGGGQLSLSCWNGSAKDLERIE
jgi:hypothetical protein